MKRCKMIYLFGEADKLGLFVSWGKRGNKEKEEEVLKI